MRLQAVVCGLIRCISWRVCKRFGQELIWFLLDASIFYPRSTAPQLRPFASLKMAALWPLAQNQHVILWARPNTRFVNTRGKWYCPGLIDSHIQQHRRRIRMNCVLDGWWETHHRANWVKRFIFCDSSLPGDDWLQVLNVRGVGTILDRYMLDLDITDRPLWLS